MHLKGIPVRAGGADLNTQEAGNPAGQPLLFLHGGLGALDNFRPLLTHLLDFRCVLMDSRGHGESTLGDAPLTYTRLAEDAEAVIAAYGLQSPVVIGHSDGAIAGLWLAVRLKSEIAGLVTLAAKADPPRPDLLETVYDLTSAQSWHSKFPDTVARYEQVNPEPDFDRLFAATQAMWRDAGPGNYPRDAVRGIRCPTLILAGDFDHLAPREATLRLAAAIERADLGLLPFASHIVHQEHPERVAPYVLEFLGRI